MAKSALNIVFGEVRESQHVINKGAFGYTRHPVYLGSILFYLGLVISTLSLLSIFVFFIISIFYNYIASFEEKALEDKYGREYLEYKKKTGFIIPKRT